MTNTQIMTSRTSLHALLVTSVACLCVVSGVTHAQTASLEKSATHAHPTRAAKQMQDLPETQNVEITVVMKVRNRQKLDDTVRAQHTPGNVAFHKWLSRNEVERDHSPFTRDAEKVVKYLADAGFANVVVAPDRMYITAEGSPAVIQKAFHTRMGQFNHRGRDSFANLDDVTLPPAINKLVLAVLGLQTLDQMHPTISQAMTPTFTGSVHGLNPTQFPVAYNASTLPAATSVSVGVITQGSMTPTIADLHQFQSQNGLATLNPTVVTIPPASSDTTNMVEWNLDTQTIQAMAGGNLANLYLYAAPTLSDSNIHKAIAKAVSDNKAAVINISLGICELYPQLDGSMVANDQSFQIAIAQGQTFAVSSGDDGSKECTDASNNPIAGASYPASSPYVIAVGGTTLYTDSAGTYGGETTWSGSGGSPSLIEPRPSWQNPMVPGSFRGVPDVAFAADPSSGAIILVNGQAGQYGGTSLAAPIFVGAWARIQAANQTRLGFPASWIYTRGGQGTPAFHDIQTGSNGDYRAMLGWDFTTGFGSFDVAATMLLTRSGVVVTTSSSSINPGQSVTLTATVSGNAPTGTVQFQANGVNIGSPVTVAANFAVLTTTQITSLGNVQITAIYSGDLNNAGSTSSPITEVVVESNFNTQDVPLPAWVIAMLGLGIFRLTQTSVRRT